MKKPTKKEQALIDELEIALKEKIKVESRLDESLKIYAELEKVTTKLSTKLDMILQSHKLTTQIFSQNQETIMQKFDTTNKAVIYVENGIFNKQGIEALMSTKKPIIKVKLNVAGKDLEIPFWFKMEWDDATKSHTDKFYVTSTGSKMLKGDVGDPFVAATSQAEESTSFLVDQGRDANELNKEDDIPF